MSISDKIKKGDSWYTSNQSKELENRKDLRRAFENRLNFIVKSIKRYQAWCGEYINSENEIKLLDAGCGDGILLSKLNKLKDLKLYESNVIKFYGVDYNPQRMAKAKKNAPKAIIEYNDLRDLNYPKEYFDIVILSQVLEHIKEDVDILKILHDVIKEDGILILGMPNEGCLLARLRNRYIEPNIIKTTDHVHFYTEKEIRTKLEVAGFKIIDIMREGFFVPCQKINSYMNSHAWGYYIDKILGGIFKSQVAGFYFLCERNRD